MPRYLIRKPEGFGFGYNPVTAINEPNADTGMSFGILRLRKGESFKADPELETACLLLDGEVRFSAGGGRTAEARRGSLFDEDPVVAHAPPGLAVHVEARSDCELAVFQVENIAGFEPEIFDSSNMLETEHRDKGRWDDAAYRLVRTVFDLRNRPDSMLVLGEVVNFPGRWSSYPPHHHPQPEIYHYRFSRPQGYGHAEMGERVRKVRQYDTLKILDGGDHSQVAAPGYKMFYIWAIRHFEGNPYVSPEFTAEHLWLKEI